MSKYKARLWKGPFSGKVIECDGRSDIVVTGPKKMSRKTKYKWQRDQIQNNYMQFNSSRVFVQPPRVDATYRMVIQRGPYGSAPWQHPDGSIFYEFVSKREYS